MTAPTIKKRFHIGLLVVHPDLDPASISAALGLDAQSAQRVGDQRQTPSGRILSGTYPETRWKYGQRHETSGQWFVERLTEFVAQIEPHKVFIRELRSTKGSACLAIEFLGDGHFGDEIPRDLMRKLIDMELDLSIECFTVPQADWL